jgi:hypothetical protein
MHNPSSLPHSLSLPFFPSLPPFPSFLPFYSFHPPFSSFPAPPRVPPRYRSPPLRCRFWPKISENARKTIENGATSGQKMQKCEFWPKIGDNALKNQEIGGKLAKKCRKPAPSGPHTGCGRPKGVFRPHRSRAWKFKLIFRLNLSAPFLGKFFRLNLLLNFSTSWILIIIRTFLKSRFIIFFFLSK